MTEATKMRSLLKGRNKAEELPLLAGCLTMAVNGQCGYMPPLLPSRFHDILDRDSTAQGQLPIALPIEWVRTRRVSEGEAFEYCLPNFN